ILAGTLGLFGLTAGILMLVLHLAGLSTVGVPYLEPVWRPKAAVRDLILRLPLWAMRRRPAFLGPQDPTRQADVVRAWTNRSGGEGGE
ncbi:MAG: spore germination protein, partial [Methanocella sp.]